MFSTSIQPGTATHMAMLYIDAHVCSIYSTFYSQQRPSSARGPATDRGRVLHLEITCYTWRAYVPVDPPWHLRSTVLKSHKYLPGTCRHRVESQQRVWMSLFLTLWWCVILCGPWFQHGAGLCREVCASGLHRAVIWQG
jgi:hypothetical protein